MATHAKGDESRSFVGAIGPLIGLFAVWKTFLLVVASLSPGPGYDTSAQLLLPLADGGDPLLKRILSHLLTRLVRWDALYYVTISSNGYEFEQYWAFGWGFTRAMRYLANAVSLLVDLPPLYHHALAGIIIAHAFHLLSVLLLFALTLQLFPSSYPARYWIASVTAYLDILSPAGLFLSAPYSESPFAAFNIAGMLLCVRCWTSDSSPKLHSLGIAMAGICFGIACTVRGNGLLSGAVFVEPFILSCTDLLFRGNRSFDTLVSLAAYGVAGCFTLAGSIYPQYLAYTQYCAELPTVTQARPWCSRTLPSVYTWVQEQYWNVGFMRYWTLSNIPLFLLALPMLAVLILTGYIVIAESGQLLQSTKDNESPGKSSTQPTADSLSRSRACLRRLAMPQILLAVLAFTNFHVQIINRLSSGYPVWYIVLAHAIVGIDRQSSSSDRAPSKNESPSPTAVDLLSSKSVQQWLVRTMVMYAIIQGGLYASFMPPA